MLWFHRKWYTWSNVTSYKITLIRYIYNTYHDVWRVFYELHVPTTSPGVTQQELTTSQSRVGKISINLGRDEVVCSSWIRCNPGIKHTLLHWFNARVTPDSRATYELITTKSNANLAHSWLARNQLLFGDHGARDGHLGLVGNSPNYITIQSKWLGWVIRVILQLVALLYHWHFL